MVPRLTVNQVRMTLQVQVLLSPPNTEDSPSGYGSGLENRHEASDGLSEVRILYLPPLARRREKGRV